jgi:magnesium chelatase subunit I
MLRAARALAALEQSDAVTSQHVDRVAEAVLVHRRRQRDTSTANSAAGGETVPRDLPQSSAAPSSSDVETGDGDWGYLPPQPAATTHVKGVIPLNVKKR